jgi:hypothetical protein
LPETLAPQNLQGAATAECSTTERRRRGRGRIGPRIATVNIDKKNAALVVNLSEGGMRVQALGHPVMPGATLRLEFQLPGSPGPIHTSGVVTWVNDSAEAGIRFAALSESPARRLREWIARNESFSAAREFMRVAGGWQAALELMAELIRMLTGARGVAVTLAAPEKRPLCCSVDKELPIRATVAAPVYGGERIIGHLEISSPELGAFDEQDLGALKVLAAVVSEMVELRAAELRQPARKASRLSARVLSRIEGILPTIRVRVVR